ncbi:MAG: ATP-binding cassette domain-containing protein [Planctomycetota bacterium]
MPSSDASPAATDANGAPRIVGRPRVQVAGVNHFFGEGQAREHILKDNHLEVRAGEIVVVSGMSGSGKTTLLTLIGTIRTVMDGSVNVLGRELNPGNQPSAAIADSLRAMLGRPWNILTGPLGMPQVNTESRFDRMITKLRLELGFIFQAHNLFASLTAYENVMMAAELAGMSRRHADNQIRYLLTRLGLAEQMQKKPSMLSGGQKQRVAIARGLVHSPRLILADEPTAALDHEAKLAVGELFQELSATPRTPLPGEKGEPDTDPCAIIIVTHDKQLLGKADRIVTMDKGRITTDSGVREAESKVKGLQNAAIELKDRDLFKDLTTATLLQIAESMGIETADTGETIIRQGDPGDLFYLIDTGEVDVIVERDGKRETVAHLGPGRYFGEVALIKKTTRNASVVATEPCRFFTIDKEVFESVLAASPSLDDELRQTMAYRQR